MTTIFISASGRRLSARADELFGHNLGLSNKLRDIQRLSKHKGPLPECEPFVHSIIALFSLGPKEFADIPEKHLNTLRKNSKKISDYCDAYLVLQEQYSNYKKAVRLETLRPLALIGDMAKTHTGI